MGVNLIWLNVIIGMFNMDSYLLYLIWYTLWAVNFSSHSMGSQYILMSFIILLFRVSEHLLRSSITVNDCVDEYTDDNG